LYGSVGDVGCCFDLEPLPNFIWLSFVAQASEFRLFSSHMPLTPRVSITISPFVSSSSARAGNLPFFVSFHRKMHTWSCSITCTEMWACCNSSLSRRFMPIKYPPLRALQLSSGSYPTRSSEWTPPCQRSRKSNGVHGPPMARPPGSLGWRCAQGLDGVGFAPAVPVGFFFHILVKKNNI
jgi:hypothetical protein